jgi:adenylate cyclase class IV
MPNSGAFVERELKAVVPDWDALEQALAAAGALHDFSGRLLDRRYDTATRDLRASDNVLRLRVYEDDAGQLVKASLDWKGPTETRGGYKLREELSTPLTDALGMRELLARLGYSVTIAIDRTIAQYRLAGAVVRLERYPRMDDLVEVEGTEDQIEAAVRLLGIPRVEFSGESLPAFVALFEARTGTAAMLSGDALAAGRAQDHSNA